MTALAAERTTPFETWQSHQFTLASGTKAYKHGIAVLDPATGKVKPGVAAAGLIALGYFKETVDATSADKPVNVQLSREIVVRWYVNGSSIAATDVGKRCYIADDQTVTLVADGKSRLGRIWAIDALKGVGVEVLTDVPADDLLEVNVLPAYVANDSAPAKIVNGATYDVPTTGAATTISLPATPVDGLVAYFTADGTKNGHTVQYRDVTTAITTALTASKRHLVVVTSLGGKWFANAYVAP